MPVGDAGARGCAVTAAAAAGETMRDPGDVEMGEVQWRPFLGVGMGCRIAVYNGISVVDDSTGLCLTQSVRLFLMV